MIDKQIRGVNKLGDNVVICDLPIVFPGATLDIGIIRTIVYTTVMQELEQRGYIVSIKNEPNKPLLKIKWTCGISDPELTKMKQYLVTHSI